jgi:hypothetical protein
MVVLFSAKQITDTSKMNRRHYDDEEEHQVDPNEQPVDEDLLVEEYLVKQYERQVIVSLYAINNPG